MKNYRPKYSRGFNLLEMVIVVAIMSLIIAIVMPNVISTLDRGRRSSTLADMRSVATALERYAADHRGYPTTKVHGELKPEVVPEYLKSLPLKDGWGNPLVYEPSEGGSSYVLRSPGKDGVFQSEAETDLANEFARDLVMIDGALVGLESSGDSEASGAEASSTAPVAAAG